MVYELKQCIDKCRMDELKTICRSQNINNIEITIREDRLTVLQYVIKKCNSNFLSHVLSSCDIDVNQVDSYGRTALWYAIMLRKYKKAKILIDFGANSTIEDGFTSFHWLVSIGKISLIRSVLKNKNFSINKRDYDSLNSLDRTALHWAAQENQVKIAEMLLKNNIAVNLAESDGRTALHIAASQGNYNFVKLLLKYHADINIIDKFGTTPKEYARLYHHEEITNLLNK